MTRQGVVRTLDISGVVPRRPAPICRANRVVSDATSPILTTYGVMDLINSLK